LTDDVKTIKKSVNRTTYRTKFLDNLENEYLILIITFYFYMNNIKLL